MKLNFFVGLTNLSKIASNSSPARIHSPKFCFMPVLSDAGSGGSIKSTISFFNCQTKLICVLFV